MAERRVVIVGGGISGLATAYFLARHGIRSTIVEKSSRLGGLIRTDYIDGCYLEAGPDSFLAAKPAVTELAAELGELRHEMIPSNDAARRIFVARAGKLLPLPRGIAMVAPAEWAPALLSPLFSWNTKARFLAETLYRPRKRVEDVAVREFVADHFGREVVEAIAEPLLTGVYGGDVSNLSARSVLPRFIEYEEHSGSLIRSLRRARTHAIPKQSFFRSFRRGMQTLTESLAQACATSVEILQGEATRAERAGNCWRVLANGEWLASDEVVLACPAYAAAALLEQIPPLASDLAAIPYTSAALVTLLYKRADAPSSSSGFGFLVPRRERRSVAAVTWIHSKFPEKMSNDIAGARAFIVGADAVEASRWPEQELVRRVEGELQRLAHVDAKPMRSLVHIWPNSMPQYTVGHRERCARIFEAASHVPGLYVTGNAYDGVGVPDCVRLAKETAKKISNCRSSASRSGHVMKST